MLGKQEVEKEIEDLEQLLATQYQLAESLDLGEAVAQIQEAVARAEMEDAIKSLELIKGKLSAELKTEAIQLISRYNEIMKADHRGTESGLILFPHKNKLTINLLEFLRRIV